MFDLRLKCQVRQARINLEKAEQRLSSRLQKSPNREDGASIVPLWHAEEGDQLEEIYRRLLTSYWTKKARDKFIPVPERSEDDEYWEESPFYRWVLTDKGISHLRMGIRQETLSANESYFRWAAVILGILAVTLPAFV